MNPAHTGRDCKFLSSADWLSADRKRTQSQSSSYSISERQKYHRCWKLSPSFTGKPGREARNWTSHKLLSHLWGKYLRHIKIRSCKEKAYSSIAGIKPALSWCLLLLLQYFSCLAQAQRGSQEERGKLQVVFQLQRHYMSSLGSFNRWMSFHQELEDVPNATALYSEAVSRRGRTAQMSQPGLPGNFSAALILLK